MESAKGGNARILEVGCAGGYFGEVLKKRGFEVWGVEISHHQAAEATQRIDYVYEGSIEAFLESDPAKEASFDFVLFGDVLEHLGNPVEVLRACADILAPEGVVLASIPNVAHMAVRLMLLEGRWDYASYGIMDDTHVRFFTRTSIVEHFSAAGYTVSLMDSVKLPIDAVGIDVDRTLLAAVLPGGGLKILCLLPFADWSVGNIRLRNPLQKWERAYGGKVRIRSIFEYAPEDLVWADVVILQREGSAFVVGLIAAVKRMGKATVLDMDDLLTDVPSFLSVYKHTIKNRKHLEEALRAVDAVTVTTPELAERMSAYTPNVHIVPNCASSSHLPARHYEAKDDPVTLIVASSDTVRVEFIVTSLSRLQSDPDLNVRLIGIGPPGKYLAEQGLEIDVRENMDYEKFKAFLASTDNAVGVIPLDDSEFSACKSAIKYVDYSLAGVPVVCSAVKPYSRVVANGETGILVDNDEASWFEGIRGLAVSPEKRKRISEAAGAFCAKEFSLDIAADKWREVFAAVTAPGNGASAWTPETGGFRRLTHFLWVLARNLARPSAYALGFRIVFGEGRIYIRNVFSRLKRHLMMAR
ncbi:MAG: methyltransferase domain-containing protein [Deltaproteobacteria bacterium]|nr:methyltransferase domain-containing protein [Deltaproteobacteria bacterium]